MRASIFRTATWTLACLNQPIVAKRRENFYGTHIWSEPKDTAFRLRSASPRGHHAQGDWTEGTIGLRHSASRTVRSDALSRLLHAADRSYCADPRWNIDVASVARQSVPLQNLDLHIAGTLIGASFCDEDSATCGEISKIIRFVLWNSAAHLLGQVLERMDRQER